MAQDTRNLCGLKLSTLYVELCMTHIADANGQNLVVIMTEHVGDITLAGSRE